jgi:hypothetical protein
MPRNKRLFIAFLIVLSGFFYTTRRVCADIPFTPPGGHTVFVSSWALLVIAIAVLVLGVSSYLLLRRIRKNK